MAVSKEMISAPASELKQIKSLVEENKILIEKLEERTKKIYAYVKWQRVFFVVKLVVIAVPIILGIIYIPPLFKDAISPYQELLGNVESVNETARRDLDKEEFEGNFNINSLINGLSR